MDENEAMATAHRARLHALVGDLFAPPALRLNDRERALMKGALVALAQTVIHDVRSQLCGQVGQSAIDAAHDEARAWTIAESCMALRTLPVAEVLRLRLDLHVLGQGLAATVAQWGMEPLRGVGHRLLRAVDPARSKVTDAYRLALVRRLDAFGNPVLAPEDLPSTQARALCWAVLASLNEEAPRRAPPIERRAAIQFVERWARAQDVSPRYDRICASLARAVAHDDMTALTTELLAVGAADLWVHALAERLSIPVRAIGRMLSCRRLDLFAALLPRASIDQAMAQKIAAASAAILGGPEDYYNGGKQRDAGGIDIDAVIESLSIEPDYADARLDLHDIPSSVFQDL